MFQRKKSHNAPKPIRFKIKISQFCLLQWNHERNDKFIRVFSSKCPKSFPVSVSFTVSMIKRQELMFREVFIYCGDTVYVWCMSPTVCQQLAGIFQIFSYFSAAFFFKGTLQLAASLTLLAALRCTTLF